MAIEVPRESYIQILDILKQNQFNTKSDQITVVIINIIKGSITANVYVDSWPNFTAIVCQILSPCINKLLIWYATSSDGLDLILERKELLPEDENPLLYGSDLHLTNQTRALQGRYNQEISMAHFPQESKYLLTKFKCPEGYTIGKLYPEHTQHILDYWPYLMNSPDRIEFFQECIQKFHSVAIYVNNDHSIPVSWTLQTPICTIGHVYTVELHRRKHLAECVVARMCELLLEEHNVPIAGIQLNNYPSVSLFKKLGFVINTKDKFSITDFK